MQISMQEDAKRVTQKKVPPGTSEQQYFAETDDPPKNLNEEDSHLPEIPSDESSNESDFEDIGAPKPQAKPREEDSIPEWARTSNLLNALRMQRKINPDGIFGTRVKQLNLDDIFKATSGNSTSFKRFRPRGSSANWTKDQLTAAEADRYDKFMGFK